MAKIQNVLLDLDGTLTDPQAGITRSIAHALEAMGHTQPPTSDLLFAIGPPLRGSFATLLNTSDAAQIETAMTLYRERFATIGLFENEVYDGVPDMLANLRAAGYRLFLATAKPHVYAVRILEHFNLHLPFAAIYGAELDGTRQDKRDLLAYLLAREQLDAGTCVMIGDRSHDVYAAQANGCASIGVTWGYGSAEELADADRRSDTPEELPLVIAALSGASSSRERI
jgi:phosphoglycolate phosphatase